MTLEELQAIHLELQDKYKQLEADFNTYKNKSEEDANTINKLNEELKSTKETNMQLFLRVAQQPQPSQVDNTNKGGTDADSNVNININKGESLNNLIKEW